MFLCTHENIEISVMYSKKKQTQRGIALDSYSNLHEKAQSIYNIFMCAFVRVCRTQNIQIFVKHSKKMQKHIELGNFPAKQ